MTRRNNYQQRIVMNEKIDQMTLQIEQLAANVRQLTDSNNFLRSVSDSFERLWREAEENLSVEKRSTAMWHEEVSRLSTSVMRLEKEIEYLKIGFRQEMEKRHDSEEHP